MEATPPRLWRGRSNDDRTRTRRDQLLQAGFDLLGTDGSAAVTMRAVCRQAGLSLRYFYESFRDTDELTLAIYDRCNAELTDAIGDVVQGQHAPADAVAAAIDAAAAYFEADRRRVRVLLREPLTDALLHGHRALMLPDLLAGLATGTGTPDIPAGERAMIASGLSGALTALVLDWTDGRLSVSRSDLVGYATALVLAGLGRPGPSATAQR